MRNTTVLISGLGIAGPTLAYWLSRQGFSTTVVERAPAPRTGGYMIDFWGIGYDVAERMGLLPVLQRDGYRIEEVRIVDESGKRVAWFDGDVFQAAAGARFVSLLRGDLAHRIAELLDSETEIIFSDSVAALHEDAGGVSVSFERGSPRRFDLVVGADGLHSPVRALAFGGGAAEKDLGYYAAAFSDDRYPHRDEGTYVSYSVPGGQIARYALRDGRSAFFLVFAAGHIAASAPRDEAAQKAMLRMVFGGTGWESDEILGAMDRAGDLYFDSVTQIRLPHWSRGRVALVGDAAFCPSLLAGQGSALAMAGAYVLAHALGAARGDHEIAFDEYERTLKPMIDAKQRGAEWLGRWFAPQTRFGMWMRNASTNLLRVPHVGGWIARRSFGDQAVVLPDLVVNPREGQPTG